MNKNQKHKEMERLALQAYERALEHVESILGNTTTDADQLESVGVELFGFAFRGVFASDEVPPLTDDRPYLIANTDTMDGPGEHWLALARYPSDPDTVFLYDSFGRPKAELVPWITQQRVVDSDLDAEQEVHESNCGQRCLAWLVVFDELGPDVALTI